MSTLEKTLETRLRKGVERMGGLCEKFTSPGRRSVPDRLVTMPGGKVWFVEMKAPGKDATLLQALDHERRRAMGFDVRVLNSREKVDAFLKEIQ